jgi:hypothetical protein
MIANVNSPVTRNDGQTTTAPGGLLGPISALAREKKTWSPALLAGVLWRALTNIGTLQEVVQLLKLQPFAEAARFSPRFAFKYLTNDYLVRGFTMTERVCCFVHHYRRLHEVLPDRLLRQALWGDVTLHEIPDCENRFTLSMGYSRAYDKEGELSLNLHVDGQIVFLLSFTIVPGWVVKSEAAEILLITRIQGMKGTSRQIHLATKVLHEVGPGALLLAALQGIAMVFGIGELAAVSATRQSSYNKELAATFQTAYDDFFAELGIPRCPAGFFFSPVPVEDKPLACIKQGHKLRTREKRTFKQQIQLACAGFFEEFAPVSSHELEPAGPGDCQQPVPLT